MSPTRFVVRWVQDRRKWHVHDRCTPECCDCPCAGCRHDPDHTPGDLPSLLVIWLHRQGRATPNPRHAMGQALHDHGQQADGQGISYDEARDQAWVAFGYTAEPRTRVATACHPAGHTGTGRPASLLPAVGHAPSNHTA